jgi:shikimate dehydrogenase
MRGQPPLDFPIDDLPEHAIVDDIVYVPRVTPLLQAAANRELRHIGGLGMLLHQAVPGFERWFGVKPQVTDALRAVIEADIEAAG